MYNTYHAPPPPFPPPCPSSSHTVVCCCVMQNYHQFCVMVDQSREMNVEESMAKRQWSTDDFNQVLGTHTEMVCCDVWNGLTVMCEMVCCDVWNGMLWCVKWYVVRCEIICLLWCVKWSVVRCEMVCCEVWNGLLWGVKLSVVMCEMVCCDVWNGLLWCVKLSVCCDVCVGPLAAFLFWWVYKLHCLRGSVAELQNLRKKLMFMQVCFWFILSMHAG